MLNGSPRKGGNTCLAFDEIQRIFDEEGIGYQAYQLGHLDVRGCIACEKCGQTGACAFDDIVNELAPVFEQADGLVVGSPVYFGAANATLVAVLDRLFYSTHFDKTMKVGLALSVARRGGTSATFDQLNRYFALTGMPVANGQYWNSAFGRDKGQAAQDEEGLQQMRVAARNMVFLMKSIQLGKEQLGMPQVEKRVRTNFIR